MPIPSRSRNKDGRWRKKRSDAGKPRGLYKKDKIEGPLQIGDIRQENGENPQSPEVEPKTC